MFLPPHCSLSLSIDLADSAAAAMAFDFRCDTETASYAWGDTHLKITMNSLSSIPGGPADPPPGAVRGSRWDCDTSVDVFVRGKTRLVVMHGAVVETTEWPVEVHTERRHVFLRSTHRMEEEYRKLSRHLASDVTRLLRDLPLPAANHISAVYTPFLRRSAEKAAFLGHTAMRLAVEVDIDAYNHMQYCGRRPGEIGVPTHAPVEEFPAGRPAPGERCGVCLDDFAGSWKVEVTACGHAFHHGCITRWMQLKGGSRCPICRADTRKTDLRMSLPLCCPHPVPLR